METLIPKNFKVLLTGDAGTAKTSTILMFIGKLDAEHLVKRINFSSATTPMLLQNTIEGELEPKGSSMAPKDGKKMVFFLDDMSMPEVNDWGDQVTLELLRQTIEYKGF